MISARRTSVLLERATGVGQARAAARLRRLKHLDERHDRENRDEKGGRRAHGVLMLHPAYSYSGDAGAIGQNPPYRWKGGTRGLQKMQLDGYAKGVSVAEAAEGEPFT